MQQYAHSLRCEPEPPSYPLAKRMKLPRYGFSLIELLAVIAVLGVLSALIFTGLQHVRRTGEKVTSVSNLRSVGMGIQSYANDHSYRLPGPLYYGQQSNYRNNSTGLLGYFLWSYLDGHEPDNTWRELEALTTPSFLSERPNESSVIYLAQRRVILPGQPGIPPFGYPKAQGDIPSLQPLTMSDIAEYDLASTWALQEVDALHPDVANWNTENYLQQPAHGDVRLTLYFDWSVREVPVDQEASQ